MPSSVSQLRALPSELRSALKSFADSAAGFQVLRTATTHRVTDDTLSSTTPDRVYVLDSSFNPPTLGHLDIALSALKADSAPGKHLLLLLATQNADKPTKPAAFEQRLTMMTIFAENLLSTFSEEPESSTSGDPGPSPHSEVAVHTAVTKYPYFIDKSQSIAGGHKSSSEAPSSPSSSQSLETPFPYPPTRQTHLIGFDTLTRLLDPKYYGPSHNLKPLVPLFANHAFRVTLRLDDGFGSKAEQEKYLSDLAEGKRESDRADSAWASQITLVSGSENTISSTRAREAAKAGDKVTLVKMCGEKVAEYIMQERLYQD